MEKSAHFPFARWRRTGMQQYLLPCCHELAGSLLQLVFDGFSPLEIRFEDKCRLLWRRREQHTFRLETYECRKLTDSVYFITAMLQGTLTPACATLVWDAGEGLATLITARVGKCAYRPRRVESQVFFGASLEVGQPLSPRTQVISPSELVGKRVLWTYNQRDTVLHIFHSTKYFRLGNLRHGPEDSCGTTHMPYEEPAFYIRLKPHLYLYGVTEDLCNRRNPSVGGNQLIYLMDSLQCRCVGSIFGLDAAGIPELLPISAIGRATSQSDPIDTLPFPLFPEVMAAEEIAQTRQEDSNDTIRG